MNRAKRIILLGMALTVSPLFGYESMQGPTEASSAKAGDQSRAGFDVRGQALETIEVPVARVRGGPSLNSEIAFRLLKGATVAVLAREGEWLQIKLNDGRSGWAHESLFADPDTPEPAITDTETEGSTEPVTIDRTLQERIASGEFPKDHRLLVGAFVTKTAAEELASMRNLIPPMFQEVVGQDVRVEVAFEDHIALTSGGKHLLVVSKVDPDSWLKKGSTADAV